MIIRNVTYTSEMRPEHFAKPLRINPLALDAQIRVWRCEYLCSMCKDFVANGWKYCPNCGAKLEEGEYAD